MMLSNLGLEIHKIKKDDLERVLVFLRLGFRQSRKFEANFKKFLLTSNASMNFFGYFIKDPNELIFGAVLAPFQGTIQDPLSDKKIDVYNICNWYMDPSVRGEGSREFMKEVVFQLSDHALTVYTPNVPSTRTFCKSGFKKMRYFKLQISIKQALSYITKDLSVISSLPSIKRCRNFDDIKLDVSFLNLAHSRLYEIKINNRKLYVCIIFKWVIEDSGWIKKRIKIGEILWVSDLKLFKEEIFRVYLILFLRKFILFMKINVDAINFQNFFTPDDQYISSEAGDHYLIFSKNKTLEFIDLIGSEKGLKF